ncbi:MAG: Fe-S cluster assembly protein SufD [Kiritimatiellae bacterium]|nr:Fe-S cluster assembly protein SufD [Kiritimatiellia bacterium]MDW8458342.1 Fe-S cluster assembly protein SufD [Verrucomicrobiota bacterium]
MTTAQLESLAHVIPGFSEGARPRVAEPPLLKSKRDAAFAAYLELPAPTARDDEWRRTDPSLFPFEQFSPAPVPARQDSAYAPGPWDAEFDVVVSVGDEALSILDASGAIARGEIVVTTLADAAVQHPELVSRYLQGPARVKEARKFSLLADAFWQIGLFIYVPPNRGVDRGVFVRYSHAHAGRAVVPRLLAIVDRGGRLTLAEHYESPADKDLLAISSRELYACAGASLRSASLQEWGGQTYHIGEDWVRAERDARVEWVTLLLGGRVSKMMVSCDVHEPNANAFMSGLFFASGNQRVDQKTLQLHSAPHTYSNLLYKGAVKDSGHSVYQGIIEAAPGAIKVDAYQMNNNLILSEGARADSLPGLQIDADDLKCSHGATIGNIDPNQLFYLRARGLSDAEARQMLVMGFFEEVIARVPYEFMRERVREDVRRKVGDAV